MKSFYRLLSLVLVLAMVMSLFPTIAMAEPVASSAEIYDLTVNNLTEPVGVEADPAFSWKMKSDAIGAAQTAYSITVTAEDGTVAWDSGWVESGDSTDIPYGGAALASSTVYTVAIAVKDQAGAETAAAKTTFETGLLEPDAFVDTNFISYQSGYISDTTTYTIDFDFSIEFGAQGFCFGMQGTDTFVMWQVNSYDNATTDKAVLLRPHFKTNGKWTAYPGMSGSTLVNKDVTDFIGYNTDEINGQTIHERIEVNGTTIRTYFGTDADNLKLADEFTHTEEIPLYNVGFRHAKVTGSSNSEAAYYDNLVIKDANGNVIYQNDFSEITPVQGSSCYSTENEILYAYHSGSDQVGILLPGKVDNPNSLPAFRKSVTVKSGLKSAKLYTSGLGVYESYINGQRVGNKRGDEIVYDELKPGFTDASERMSYSSYDVTWMMSEGENVLSSIVTTGWWSGSESQLQQGSELAYLAKLILTYEDGSREVINTDTSWKSFKAAPVLSATGIYEGESYDACVSTDWMLPDYDETGWGNAKVNTEFQGELTAWHGTTVRVREDLELAPKTIQVYEGATGASSGYYGKINVVATYEDGQDIVLEPGQTLLVNFGQNFAGREAFTVTSERGTTIHVEHGEWLNDNNGQTSRGNDGPEGSIYNANYRTAAAATNYITAGGTESWNPLYTFYGFQYIAFTADKTVTFHDIRGEVLTSVQGETGTMTTSNEGVNQLISNAVWGMRGNYLSIPTDCPQRNERMGWTADTQVFGQTGMFLGDNKAFLEKAAEDIRDSQYTDPSSSLYGAYSDVAPNTGYNGDGAYGWADSGIIVPYTLYMMYGDVSVIEESWDSMCLYMDAYLAKQTYGGTNRYNDWLCYETQTTTTKNMLALSFHCWDALMMVEMANAIGNTEAAAKYQAVYDERKAQYQSEFVNEDGTIKGGIQVVCLYALYVDLLPNEDSVNKVTDQLISNIEHNGNKLGTGFLGTAIIMNTLVKVGRSDVAYKLLLQRENPSWLYSVDQGATTYWERWNTYTIATGFGNVGMNSFNHYAYGAVIGWMYNQAAGIGYDKTNPGFKHIILEPQPDQSLGTIEASYDSAYGTIVSNMRYEGSTWIYEAQIPANTTATIYVPVEQIDTLKVNGKAPTGLTLVTDGLTYEGYADGVATFEAVAAPKFTFTSTVTVEPVVLDDINDDSVNGLDTPLPNTAKYAAGQTEDTRALQGWFSVNDPELILNKTMTQGNSFSVAARVYIPSKVLSGSMGKFEGKNKYNVIASLGDSSFGLRLKTTTDGACYVQTFIGNGSKWFEITMPAVDASFGDQWHDIVATYSGTTLTLIVDGTVQAQQTDATDSIVDSGVPFSVGYDPTKNRYNQDMAFEQLVVYNEALTVEQLAGNHWPTDENVVLWMDYDVSAAQVVLDKTEAKINIGEELTLTSTVMPDAATDKAVIWTSSDEMIATVVDGKVTGVGIGEATIIATTSNGLTAKCVVTVTDPSIEEAIAAVEAARVAAETARKAAEEAQTKAEEAAKSVAEDKSAAELAASNAKTAAEAAKAAQIAAETAQTKAEEAQKAAAENNAAAAEEAKNAVEDAIKAAEEAAKATTAAATAASAAASAQKAQEAAEAAQVKAEAAQKAADEAAKSISDDMSAAETAQTAAEAAQTAAELAQKQAEAAKAAAQKSAESAEESNVEAAEQADTAAKAAAASAASAEAAADSAKASAEAAKAAQIAKIAAEEAAEKTAADKAVAEQAAAVASLNLAKFDALTALAKKTEELTADTTAAQTDELVAISEAARKAIRGAETEESVGEIFSAALAEMEAIVEVLCAGEEFTDVDVNEWYHDAIDFVINKGMMSGNGNGTFSPNTELSRAMLVQILYNIEGRPEVETEKSFSDVSENDWYYNAVLWAAENSIVLGNEDGTYAPDDNVTREQMVTILYRYAGSPDVEDAEITFADAADVDDYATTAVIWAVANEVVKGKGDNRFDPDGNSTRAETAQVMMNYFKK